MKLEQNYLEWILQVDQTIINILLLLLNFSLLYKFLTYIRIKNTKNQQRGRDIENNVSQMVQSVLNQVTVPDYSNYYIIDKKEEEQFFEMSMINRGKTSLFINVLEDQIERERKQHPQFQLYQNSQRQILQQSESFKQIETMGLSRKLTRNASSLGKKVNRYTFPYIKKVFKITNYSHIQFLETFLMFVCLLTNFFILCNNFNISLSLYYLENFNTVQQGIQEYKQWYNVLLQNVFIGQNIQSIQTIQNVIDEEQYSQIIQLNDTEKYDKYIENELLEEVNLNMTDMFENYLEPLTKFDIKKLIFQNVQTIDSPYTHMVCYQIPQQIQLYNLYNSQQQLFQYYCFLINNKETEIGSTDSILTLDNIDFKIQQYGIEYTYQINLDFFGMFRPYVFGNRHIQRNIQSDICNIHKQFFQQGNLQFNYDCMTTNYQILNNTLMDQNFQYFKFQQLINVPLNIQQALYGYMGQNIYISEYFQSIFIDTNSTYFGYRKAIDNIEYDYFIKDNENLQGCGDWIYGSDYYIQQLENYFGRNIRYQNYYTQIEKNKLLQQCIDNTDYPKCFQIAQNQKDYLNITTNPNIQPVFDKIKFILDPIKQQNPLFSINLELDNTGMWDNQLWEDVQYMNLAFRDNIISKQEFKLFQLFILQKQTYDQIPSIFHSVFKICNKKIIATDLEEYPYQVWDFLISVYELQQFDHNLPIQKSINIIYDQEDNEQYKQYLKHLDFKIIDNKYVYISIGQFFLYLIKIWLYGILFGISSFVILSNKSKLNYLKSIQEHLKESYIYELYKQVSSLSEEEKQEILSQYKNLND